MKKGTRDCDVIVIGAGAAGLAAASELAANGRSVRVIEARDRLGGRILTHREPDLPIPLELGAEFIHGRSVATLEWLARSNQLAVDATQTRWTNFGGRQLAFSDDIFEQLKRAVRKVRAPSRDIPFASFLNDHARGKLPPRLRGFARMLVEGFDAADTSLVSTFEILEEWTGSGAADAPTFRPIYGYGSLIDAVYATLSRDRARVQLNSIVHEIHWERGAVSVHGMQFGQPFSIAAPQAIVTLPLGVLQRSLEEPGSVRFTPALPSHKLAALSMLVPGPVIKIVLRFRSAFWETLDGGRYRDGAFFQAPSEAFPTFWSLLPIRAPVLIAWTAGPNAARLAATSRDRIVQAAVTSLQHLFGRRARVAEQIVGAQVHDWQRDPFSRGAYSYMRAGGSDARARLASPLQGTLFFAGEAVDTQGEAATVGGALQSGRRAAREALRGERDRRTRARSKIAR